jgi:hypothetical protein
MLVFRYNYRLNILSNLKNLSPGDPVSFWPKSAPLAFEAESNNCSKYL